jgi:hypothetical protein
MTQIPCLRVSSPALMKPMTITVVAELDWTRAVTAAPTMKATRVLFVMASRILLSFWPATALRPSDMSFIPNRNRPNPPKV